MAEQYGSSSPEYVDSVDWYGLLSKTKEKLVSKERELSLKIKDLDALKNVLDEETAG